MAVAVFAVHVKRGLDAQNGRCQNNVFVGTAALTLAFTGPSSISLDAISGHFMSGAFSAPLWLSSPSLVESPAHETASSKRRASRQHRCRGSSRMAEHRKRDCGGQRGPLFIAPSSVLTSSASGTATAILGHHPTGHQDPQRLTETMRPQDRSVGVSHRLGARSLASVPHSHLTQRFAEPPWLHVISRVKTVSADSSARDSDLRMTNPSGIANA
jgi:hypothetical protein